MANVEVVENYQVEWHKERGVLYVHNKDTGATILRISRLPKSTAKLAEGQIDVPVGHTVIMPEEA